MTTHPDGGGPLGLPDLSRTIPDMRTAGARVVAWALSQWAEGVRDAPEDYPTITGYLRAVGDARDYPAPGRGGRPYAWCGAFAAAAWRAVGLHPEIARRLWPSTYRLALYGTYGSDENLWEETHAELPGGEVLGIKELHGDRRRYCEIVPAGARPIEPLQPGDVVCVGDPGGPWWGSHVVIVDSLRALAPGSFLTIEGNAVGELGRSLGRGEGVVRNARRLEEIRLHLRPSPWDLVPEARYI